MHAVPPRCGTLALGDYNMLTKKRLLLLSVIMAVSGIIAGYVLTSITEKKYEAKNPFFRVVDIEEFEDDASVWGKNFPQHYDMYKRTVDQERTKHGGSESLPQTPTKNDPRTVVSESKIEADPRLVKMWAGYAFSKDFREERGHAFMLEDQMYTERQKFAAQPGACLNCHASTFAAMSKLGDGDLKKGFDHMNKMAYQDAAKLVKHPISCIDCHDPKSMELRITKPAFMEGIKQFKKSLGVEDYDVNKLATRQEMRSFVCAQCHVEYYFSGPEKRLTFPWDKGLKADQILEYYKENGHKDWIHAETQAPVLKAQHPEFELWSQGVHAKSGVSCVDCHMPYQRVGAMKITNHHVRSPLLNINKSCQTCHHTSENELVEKVLTIQGRHLEMRDRAMDALMQLIDDIKQAQTDKVEDAKILKAQQAQKEAQFLIDFIEAENSSGFHAPQEAARLIVKALDIIRSGQLSLK